jgi:hypothetical protein
LVETLYGLYSQRPNRMETYFLVLFVVLAFLLSVLNTAYITNNADYATQKYYRVAATTTYLVCAALYVFLYYYFQQDSTYLVTTLMGILMLVCLPAVLVSISVATIIGGNL